MPRVYYNEINKHAAQWLRNLITAGRIAPGDVDERSIEDVRPDDLRGYDQCHFFAGIGVWSYALRLAGWPDDRPVWTGSCPCQPFSAAGKGLGFDDERHLWPAWAWLIGERRPPTILGEQVASKDVEPWIDLVQADLEAMGYALGCVPFPSAGVGAPHIRDRSFFVAYTNSVRGRRNTRAVHRAKAEVDREGIEDGREPDGPRSGREAGELADADIGTRGQGCALDGRRYPRGDALARSRSGGDGLPDGFERIEPAGPTNGFWRDADWLLCRDEKWRPVEPGSFPLVDGASSRVGRLRAYGNAINAHQAAAFIQAADEVIAETPIAREK
ncbi:DNA cytosine methyltransferase [Caballeronia sp. INDeC2]|uniref:DNA cytosine methyltransferase n=1 Tax=Caballeronia sp. INDeC2 TaxID=2921747 RepID=UPI002028F4C4